MFRSKALAVWLLLAPLAAQTITWHQLTPSASPPARGNAAMAYHGAIQRCVLFGGGPRGTGATFGDTWVWNGTTWADVTPIVSPPPRAFAGMAEDPVRLRVILFGGRLANGNAVNDTLAWDGTVWTQLSPANPPPARFGMPLAYDPVRQVIVGFGGFDQSLGVVGGPTARTYEFDGTDWSEVLPLQFPPQRSQSQMYFNEARGRIQIHSGLAASGIPRNDVWEWDGVTWTDLTPLVVPEERIRPGLAYDKSLQRMVRIGGAWPLITEHADQWFWDGQWQNGTGTIRPSEREGCAMVFDDARQQLVMFSGARGIGADTWVSESGLLASRAQYGSSCAVTSVLTSGRPIVGTTVNVQLVLPPSPFAFLALGWNSSTFMGQPLPMDLTSVGMTGCELLTSSDVVGLPISVAGNFGSYLAVLPNTPTLIGSSVYWQAFALAPGANPLEIMASNGLSWMIGDL